MTRVLATAADERYGWHLLNMLGSVQANAPDFDRIEVFDLGLSALQRRLVRSVRGVRFAPMPAFAPHWSEGFAWKPWIWTHVDADELLYLDAGVTVLRPLDDAFASIRDHGYFVVSQDRRFGEIVPSDYYALYDVSHEWDERSYVAAGIIGFRRDQDFFREVIVPTYEDCLAGRSLGFSANEAAAMNWGLQRTSKPVIRDCLHFRHDQTILNLHLFARVPAPVVADVEEFGGWRSPQDHPRQVIWSHRTRGDLRYLPRVRYRGSTAVAGLAVGTAIRARRLWELNRWLVRPATYLAKARKLLNRPRP